MRVFLRKLWSTIKDLRLHSCLRWNMKLFSTQCQGIRPHLAARGKSHGFPRVASRTWDICSRDGGDVPSKVVYVQQHQDSSLLARDSIGLSSRPVSATGPLSIGVGGRRSLFTCHRILGFLSIFKRSQPSSNFVTSISQ